MGGTDGSNTSMEVNVGWIQSAMYCFEAAG